MRIKIGRNVKQALAMCCSVAMLAACTTTQAAEEGSTSDANEDAAIAPEEADTEADDDAAAADEDASGSVHPDAANPPPDPGHYDEAPGLTERVERGELPPIEERLPDEPMVVEPRSEIGQYGGTIRLAMNGAGDDTKFRYYAGYEPLVRWGPEWDVNVLPGIAHDWEISEDATEFTFHLREGIRWSDGEPFTAHDLVFGYNDVKANEDLSPGVSSELMDPQGNLAEASAPDDYTFVLTFSEPYGLFLLNEARGHYESILTRYPRHYLEQFHADYNSNVQELADERGFDDWIAMFQSLGDVIEGTGYDARWVNTELPVIGPWVITEPAYEGSRVRLDRNPYYWKVDPEGNQLPYVDELQADIFEDQEVIAFRAAGGEIDFQTRHLDHEFRPLLADSQAQGDYELVQVESSDMNTLLVNFNFNHPDEELGEIFRNRDFRVGLSHAIDRDEMIDLVYFDQGEPAQAAPKAGSNFYNEELATQHLDYDVDLANEHLDQAGLGERNDEGYRLRPDGELLLFDVDVAHDRSAEHVDALELIRGYWAEVGVRAEVNAIQRDLRNERRDTAQFDAGVRDGSAGLLDAILRPRWYLPHGTSSYWAPMWGMHYLGEGGEEPPADSVAWEQWEIYDQILASADPEEQQQLMDQVLSLSAEAFWTIGVSTSPDRVGVRSSALRNTPDSVFDASAYSSPGPYNPPTFFFAEED